MQSSEVQSNGLWVVLTNPASYGEEENELLADVIKRATKEDIPVYTCRASELPRGWKLQN